MQETKEVSEAELEGLRVKYDGEIAVVNTVKGTAVFRCPTEAEFDRYTTFIGKAKGGDGNVMRPIRDLCSACVVYPEKEEFVTWCKAKPGIPGLCLGFINELTGESEKK